MTDVQCVHCGASTPLPDSARRTPHPCQHCGKTLVLLTPPFQRFATIGATLTNLSIGLFGILTMLCAIAFLFAIGGCAFLIATSHH